MFTSNYRNTAESAAVQSRTVGGAATVEYCMDIWTEDCSTFGQKL